MKKKWMTAALSSMFLLAAAPAAHAASTQTAAPSGNQQRVLVVFKDRADETLITNKKGHVRKKLKNLPVVTATVPASALDGLKKNPKVQSVEQDVKVTVKSQTTSWGISDVQAPAAWSNGYTGKGVNVAVVDTGIAPHGDLKIAGGTSVVGYTSSYADDNGHGTHVAGIIGALNNSTGVVGVAPDVNLYAVKALDSDGSGYLSDIIAGIDWAITNHMDIVNLSLGSSTDSYALHQEIDKAYKSGVLVVAAAGNDGGSGTADTVEYPAKYSSAIAVSAVDSNNRIASFSSRGNEVEVAAPGVNILSTYLNNSYAGMSGTSMATPMVAGRLALLKQANPTASAADLRSLLDQQVHDLGAAGRDTLYGYGLIQADGATPQPTAAQPAPVLSSATATKLMTGKASYFARETVTMTAHVVNQDGAPVSGAAVQAIITTPRGSKLTGKAMTNSNGQVVFKFLTSRYSVKGTYQVQANTSLTGYTGSSASVSFQLK
ncbi:S8 family serine peptidase [Ectobacillus ponti]|uniref:S8 family serine peptidase n=1 Tax=Ectobacillus ponti TaxID=2961894 RepID=A0AA41X5C8_9BACI|nr:S8 family serine peptidase [Ectobacillus ponti]MCP8968992.1 S8 family serine peptidase [Ectobacillus ponti]